MSVQTNLFPEAPEPAAEPVPVARERGSGLAPVWLQRTSLFILVLFCVYLGLVLAALPWWNSIWDHNLLLQSSPRVWAVMRTGFARGLISGLGLVDIWIGVSEAVHYRDDRG